MAITLRGQSNEMMVDFEKGKIPQILGCFLIAGANDYILRVARDVDDFGKGIQLIYQHFPTFKNGEQLCPSRSNEPRDTTKSSNPCTY